MNATRSAVITGLIAGAGALLITSLGRTSSARKRTALGRGATDDANFMDLNSAPAEELKRLGLDDLAVGRIVENRPYRNKLELVSRMVIPENLYGEIRHHVGVRESAETAKVA